MTQASIVQCPELCGRGASSLTSTSPAWVTNISTASTPTRSSFSAMWRAIASARIAVSAVDPRGGDRGVEDVVGVLVFDRRVGRPGAVAPARDDDRNLAGEIDKAFEDADLAAHPPPRLIRLGLRRQRHLALAVIAHPHAFQHRGIAEIAHRADSTTRHRRSRDKRRSRRRSSAGNPFRADGPG